jgi:chromosomal replication initiator protein
MSEHAQRMNQLWQTTVSTLQAQLPRPEIDTWLRNTTLLTMDNGIATISASTSFQKEGLENRYLAPIRRALGDIIGAPIQARVVIGAPEHR